MNKTFQQSNKIIYLLQGLLFSYIITAFILLLLSFLMLKLDLSGAVISAGIHLVYILSSFVGGFFIGKKMEEKKFLWGVLMGVFYFVVFLLITLFMNRVNPIELGGLFTVFLICGFSGMLGGMLS